MTYSVQYATVPDYYATLDGGTEVFVLSQLAGLVVPGIYMYVTRDASIIFRGVSGIIITFDIQLSLHGTNKGIIPHFRSKFASFSFPTYLKDFTLF